MQHTQTINAAVGVNNVGKSTSLDALLGIPLCETNVIENTAIPSILLPDPEKAEQQVYGVIDRDGKCRHAPLSAFADFTPLDTDERLLLYHSGTTDETILGDAVFIDVPGRDSVSMENHNLRAAAFLTDPRNYDILLDVRTPRCSEHTAIRVPTPTPRIVLLNKIDELCHWGDADPLARLENTVQAYRDKVLFLNDDDLITPVVIGFSAIVGLAATLLEDTLLERLLKITQAHGTELLSSDRFFEMETAKILLESANCQLTAPWWRETRPAYPALRCAIGLAIEEGITATDVLRQRMLAFSGVEVLRQTIHSLIPITQYRRDTLDTLSRYAAVTQKNETELAKARSLLTQTDRLSQKHATRLAASQEHAFFQDARAFLSKQAAGYAKRVHRTQQNAHDTVQAYVNRVNATLSGADL